MGHFVEFGGDQLGSRLIQSKLTTANSDDKERVFREIEPNSAQLMKDVYGNYVIQKFFEHGSQAQKTVLANDMRGQIFDLSTGKYACRVVQKVRRCSSTILAIFYEEFRADLTIIDTRELGTRTHPCRPAGGISQGNGA